MFGIRFNGSHAHAFVIALEEGFIPQTIRSGMGLDQMMSHGFEGSFLCVSCMLDGSFLLVFDCETGGGSGCLC